MPSGPQAIPVAGQADNVVSTYTVSVVDDVDNRAYVFSPDGKTRNPYLRLYRGQTYRFEVDAPGYGIAFKTVREIGDSNFYTNGVSTGNTYVETGTIEFTVPIDAPNVIYYVSKTDVDTGGVLTVYDIADATAIDVEAELIGKKTYSTSNNIVLSNGMKIYFQGRVTPEKYATGNWYVGGVGDALENPPPGAVDVWLRLAARCALERRLAGNRPAHAALAQATRQASQRSRKTVERFFICDPSLAQWRDLAR